MRTTKFADELEGGDVIFNADGDSMGVLLDDPYKYVGYDSVEFDLLRDDVTERVRVSRHDRFDVRPWRGSGAV